MEYLGYKQPIPWEGENMTVTDKGMAKPPVCLTNEKAPGISVYFLEVNAQVAHELLAFNTKGQRNLSKANVERYASDMITMDWIINGDTIKISDEGELLDGQHRLNAIKESGEAQVLLVVHGISKQAMETIDAGRKRTFSDQLRMEGIRNHSIVAAIGTRLWYWDKGNYGVRGIARIEGALHLNAVPSTAQKRVVMAKYEKAYGITVEAAAAFGVRAYNARPGISASTYGLAWIILSGIDPTDKTLRETFFHELLVEAADPKMGYAIQALINRLGRLKGDKFDNVDQLDALFTVYTAWINNKKMETVRPPRPIRPNILALPKDYKELEA